MALAMLGWLALVAFKLITISLAAHILSAIAVTTLVVLYLRLWRLKKRNEALAGIQEATGLHEYRAKNEGSPFMPSELLKRQGVKDLCVMAYGCSKWTRQQFINQDEAIEFFKSMRFQGGAIKFLAASPMKLMEIDDAAIKSKALRNADSLMTLSKFAQDSAAGEGTFEIKIYDHMPTLRLIVINHVECIVGHYKEDTKGRSEDTPLLVFRAGVGGDDGRTAWDFGHAFIRLFNHEWSRAHPPTDEDWRAIESLQAQYYARKQATP